MRSFLLHLSAIPALAFPIIYVIVARWWRSTEGLNTMTLSVALALLLAHGLLLEYLGDYDGRELVTMIILVLINLALWWRLANLVRVQILNRRRGRHERNHPQA